MTIATENIDILTLLATGTSILVAVIAIYVKALKPLGKYLYQTWWLPMQAIFSTSERLEEFSKTLIRLENKMDKVESQFHNNGGFSLRDRVDKLQTRLVKIDKGIAINQARQYAHLEMSEHGYFSANIQGHMEWFNKRQLLITGRQLPDMLHSGWVNAIHNDDEDAVMREWKFAVNSHRSFEMVFRWTHYDTSKISTMSCECWPLFDKDTKELLGFFGKLTHESLENKRRRHADGSFDVEAV